MLSVDNHMIDYEWLHPNKVKYWYAEEKRVYELYIKARNQLITYLEPSGLTTGLSTSKYEI